MDATRNKNNDKDDNLVGESGDTSENVVNSDSNNSNNEEKDGD